MIRPYALSLLSALALIAACGGADAPAKPQPPAPTPAVSQSPRDVCVQSFVRERECTAAFIPALVAARVEADVPAGIAATDQSIGREALVARANEEWATDSTDEAIGATCDDLAAKIPAEQQPAMTEQVKQCMAAEGCPAYVDCMVGFMQAQWKAGSHP